MSDPHLLKGLRLLQARDWFDAHEELEAVWQAAEPGDWRETLQALIQHAVAFCHLSRGNAMGAFNVWSKAKARAKKLPPEVNGVELAAWGAQVEAFYGRIDLAQRVRGQLEGGVAAGEEHIQLTPLPPAEEWPIPSYSPALDQQVAAAQ